MIKTRSQKPPRLKCSKCGTSFRQEVLAPDCQAECDGCSQKQRLFVFPAFTMRLGDDQTPDVLPKDGEASCYYYPDRKATSVCDDCGRYLSEFIKVSIGKHTSCLTCIDVKRTDHDDPRLETRRTAYDNRALILAAVPPLTIIGAGLAIYTVPAALFFTIRDWKHGANSVIPRGRWKFVLAGVLAVLQLVVFAFVIYGFVKAAQHAAAEAMMTSFDLEDLR